jgi:hypothetical protein
LFPSVSPQWFRTATQQNPITGKKENELTLVHLLGCLSRGKGNTGSKENQFSEIVRRKFAQLM